MKIFFIYKTTCLINNKFYIGMRTSYNINDGYIGSGKLLQRSIKIHGSENFKFEVLEYCANKEELCKREKEIVNEYLLKDPLCMNLKIGGEGGFMKSYVTVKDENNNYFYVNIENEDYKSGKLIHVAKNNKLSDDNKQKRKDSKVYSNMQTGLKNHMFNKTWMSNPITKESTRIKKEDIDLYIENGWINGRSFWKNKPNKKGQLSPTKGLIMIFNEKLNKRKYIQPSELENYIIDGWIRKLKIKK